MADDDESRRQTAREVMREGVKEIDAPPSASEFFAEHVLRNRPLVVRGAASQWPAIAWSAVRLSDAHGEEIVKVAPLEVSGPNAHLDKWLEPSEAWQHEEHEYCCDAHQLLVVSALRVKMRLRTFFKRLSAPDSVSFYADGAGNLDHSFSFLRDDFAPPPFAQQLHLKRADLWMGGKSISRMHYDNLDNVFAQTVGSKTFILCPPEAGAALQGGKRLRKAARLYTHPGTFARAGGGVLHETVLNYCGVDRPQMRELQTISVTLHPGDMLCESIEPCRHCQTLLHGCDLLGPSPLPAFRLLASLKSHARLPRPTIAFADLPFGWWHEVHSHPDESRGRMCASVSHFYTPFFCRLGGKEQMQLGSLMVNPAYNEGAGEQEEGPRCADGTGAPENTSMRFAVWMALAALAIGGAFALRRR
jgi:hypothetical protein